MALLLLLSLSDQYHRHFHLVSQDHQEHKSIQEDRSIHHYLIEYHILDWLLYALLVLSHDYHWHLFHVDVQRSGS